VVTLRLSIGLCVVVLSIWHVALLVRHAGPCSESIDDVGMTGPMGLSHGVVVRGAVSPVVLSPAPPAACVDIHSIWCIVPSFSVYGSLLRLWC
jgi:hypothetical protein